MRRCAAPRLAICAALVFAPACTEHVTVASTPGDATIIVDPEDGPGQEPGIVCDLPPLECEGEEAHCGELVQYDPFETESYVDYPVNGESSSLQERSWVRRDLAMAFEHAAAYVACKASLWDLGNGGPVGLNDASAEDGGNPGGYWEGTHEDGLDQTMAYFQTDTADNAPRVICEHTDDGEDEYHCLETPHLLDRWRTALFVGTLSEHPRMRVIGCDGLAGLEIDDAFAKLCADGWLGDYGCAHNRLSYELTDGGAGWYLGHHHHMQASINAL